MALYFKNVKGMGRGVFSDKKIKKGETIEICPVIVLPEKDIKFLDKIDLERYYYMWGKGFKKAAISLGYGSLYNHSYNPNAQYIRNSKDELMKYVSLQDIPANTEITVNYNGDPKDQTNYGF